MPQCESLNTYRMSHVTLVASKNVKFRLSQNLTKFDVVTRLHENIPTVKSISSSEIYKNSRFLAEMTILPFFRKLKFSWVLHSSPLKRIASRNSTQLQQITCVCHGSHVICCNCVSDFSTGLLHPHRNLGRLPGSLTPTQKFGTSPRVSYTHTKIRDTSPGLLHPHRNSGFLPRSFTPTQKFGIPPRVSYTHTEIRDISPGLLHPYRNSGYLPGSLTPIQKFRISPRVSYTHTRPFRYYRGSPSP